MLKIGTLIKHLDDGSLAIVTGFSDIYDSGRQQYRLYCEYHVFHLACGTRMNIPDSNIYYSYEVINESR